VKKGIYKIKTATEIKKMYFFDIRENEFILFHLVDCVHKQLFTFGIDDVLSQDKDTDLFEFFEIYSDIRMAKRNINGIDVHIESANGPMDINIIMNSNDEASVTVKFNGNSSVSKKCKFNNFNYISRSIETRLNQQEKNLDDVSNKIIEIFEKTSTASQAVDY
jgi:hypothetical protein